MSEQITEIQEAQLAPKQKTLWLKAISAVELQNHSYAISLCQAILKDAPGFVEARKLSRKCAVKVNAGSNKKKGGSLTQMFSGGYSSKLQSQSKKEPLTALISLEKELAKDPYNDQLNDVLFDTAIRLNLQETATYALETVRKGGSGNTKLLHKLAEYYLARNLPGDAAEIYGDIVKHDSTDIHAVKGQKDATARATMQKDKWTDNSTLSDVTKDQEGNDAADEDERTAMTRDQMKEKLGRLMELYNQDQNNLSVVKQIARIYEDLEYWPDSYVFYNWAYECSNKDVTLKNKADQMKNKATDETVKELEAQSAADPDNEELKNQLITMKRDRAVESVSNAQTRVDQNPSDPQLRFDLGLALFNSGEFNDAIPHLQQAKRNPHIRTRVLLTLGRSFDAKGMYDLAMGQLTEALADLHGMDGTKKEVLYEMGLIATKMDDKVAALDSFKQIYEVDYGYRDVAQRVEQSYSA